MKKILILVLLVFILGCAKKATVHKESTDMPEATLIEEPADTKMQEESVDEIDISGKDVISEEDLDISSLTPEEEAATLFQDVLFDFDKYVIKPEARPIMDSIASFLSMNANLNIVIEGHCDERGTNGYNLALGEKRAKATRDYFISLGVSPLKMIVITYGEEKQLCDENNESCWQKNRRAHFAIVSE